MIIGHTIFHIIDQFKRRDEKNKVALAVELSIVVNQVEKSSCAHEIHLVDEAARHIFSVFEGKENGDTILNLD